MPIYVWRYSVSWDKQKHVFSNFDDARAFLANEIWWLAEDTGDPFAKKAWEEVRKWKLPDKWLKPDLPMKKRLKERLEITVGSPSATYRLEPEFI